MLKLCLTQLKITFFIDVHGSGILQTSHYLPYLLLIKAQIHNYLPGFSRPGLKLSLYSIFNIPIFIIANCHLFHTYTYITMSAVPTVSFTKIGQQLSATTDIFSLGIGDHRINALLILQQAILVHLIWKPQSVGFYPWLQEHNKRSLPLRHVLHHSHPAAFQEGLVHLIACCTKSGSKQFLVNTHIVCKESGITAQQHLDKGLEGGIWKLKFMQFVIRHKQNSPRRDIRHLAKVYVSCPLQYPETTNQGGNIVTEAL